MIGRPRSLSRRENTSIAAGVKCLIAIVIEKNSRNLSAVEEILHVVVARINWAFAPAVAVDGMKLCVDRTASPPAVSSSSLDD